MKNIRKALASVLLFALSLSAPAQEFSWLYPKPTGNERYSIFKSGENLYVGGYAGSVVKTSNDGASWSILNTGLTFANGAIDNVKFTDPNTGYLAGQMYGITGLTVRKTTNAGLTWSVSVVDPAGMAATADLQFPSASTGYLAGSQKVYKTVDAAATWTKIFDSVTSGISAVKLRFLDEQEGWLIGRTSGWPSTSKIYHTTDGGANWTLTYTGQPGVDFTAIWFDNPYTGFIATNNSSTWPSVIGIQKISADGESVTDTYSGTGNRITRLQFSDKTGYALSESKGLIKTTNYGDSWEPITSPDLTTAMRDLYVEDASTVYVACGAGMVEKTTDGGATWSIITGHKSIEAGSIFAMSTADKNTVYATEQVYLPTSEYTNYLLKSTNGGATWSRTTTGINGSMSALAFGDNNTGFFAGQGGAMYKTTDGGLSWTASSNGIATDASLTFTSVVAQSGSIAYAAGGNNAWGQSNYGVIYKTTDGGANWNQVYYDASDYITSVRIYNNLVGFATGYRKGATYATDSKVNNLVLKTTDGGISWTAVTIGAPGDSYNTQINSVSIVDQNTIYASGAQRYLYKSTDGGATWTTIDFTGFIANATYMSIHSVQFADANTGYAFPNQGSNLVVKTTDGGASWISYDMGNWQIGNVNNAVLMLDANRIITAGTNSSLVLFSPNGNLVLPVTMQSFTGSLVKNNAVLNWKVAGEQNLAYYEVEQSFNNGSFSVVGRVSPGLFAYSFARALEQPGSYTYRIRSVDRDGKSQLSKVVLLSFKKEAAPTYKINNPVQSRLRIEQASVQPVEVRVIAMNGLLAAKTTSSNQVIEVDVANLASGIYTLQIVGKDGTFNTKFVKN